MVLVSKWACWGGTAGRESVETYRIITKTYTSNIQGKLGPMRAPRQKKKWDLNPPLASLTCSKKNSDHMVPQHQNGFELAQTKLDYSCPAPTVDVRSAKTKIWEKKKLAEIGLIMHAGTHIYGAILFCVQQQQLITPY